MYDQPRATSQMLQTGAAIGSGLDPVSRPLHYLGDAGSAPTPSRAELAALLSEQETATLELGDVVEALGQKLHPILVATQPTPVGTGTGQRPSATPMGGCISENTMRIMQFADRLRDIRDRAAL